jgi:hypothetical protein
MRTRTVLTSLVAVAAAPMFGLALPADAATSYQVTVTCTVPQRQPERQLAPNSCANYLPDATQTFTAKVRTGSGAPAVGVSVKWTDSALNARFRLSQNPCTTNAKGVCSAELVVNHPKRGQTVTVTATAGSSSGKGYLTLW